LRIPSDGPLTASLLTGAASAGALMEFPNVSARSPARLLGYLARPDTGVSKVLGSHSNDAGPYAFGRRAAWLRRHFRRLCDEPDREIEILGRGAAAQKGS
jgi:hypothetical protein